MFILAPFLFFGAISHTTAGLNIADANNMDIAVECYLLVKLISCITTPLHSD